MYACLQTSNENSRRAARSNPLSSARIHSLQRYCTCRARECLRMLGRAVFALARAAVFLSAVLVAVTAVVHPACTHRAAADPVPGAVDPAEELGPVAPPSLARRAVTRMGA